MVKYLRQNMWKKKEIKCGSVSVCQEGGGGAIHPIRGDWRE